MMNNLLFIIPFLFLSQICSAQKSSKNEEILKQINALLVKDITDKDVNQLVLLSKRIETRNSIISDLNSQINSLNNQISLQLSEIKELENNIYEIKQEYAQLIILAYKLRKSQSDIAFIFSANSFNRAYKRLIYIQFITDYRRKQAQNLQKKKIALKNKLDNLQVQNEKRIKVMESLNAQHTSLSYDLYTKNYIEGVLTQNESVLKQQLTEYIENCRIISKTIDYEFVLSKTKNFGKTDLLAKHDKQTENLFSKNSLLWPCDNGIVVSGFGEHPHPVIPNITVKNDGIDIAVENNTKVKSVIKGIVTRVFSLPGSKQCLIVKHENYYMVYANLDSIFVKEGQTVLDGHYVGIVSNSDSKVSVFNFQLWHNKEKLNPLVWLTNR